MDKKAAVAVAVVIVLYQLAFAEMRSSVTYLAPSGTANNITFTFDKQYECFQYATGDWGVVGPIIITSMSPAASGGQHGWMVNPAVSKQAFDNRAGDYDAALMPSLPYAAQPGRSIIPSTTFRPPYAGTAKPEFYTTDLRADLLPSLNTPPGSITKADAERRFRYSRLDHINSYHAEESMPYDAVPKGYGGDMTQGDMPVYFWLCQNSATTPEKMKTLTYVVQSGIDLYGCYKIGTSWFRGGGGIGQGRCLTFTFAAGMLGSSEMKSTLASAPVNKFLETNQLYKGANANKALFGIPIQYGQHWYWSCINGNCSSKDLRDPAGWIDGGQYPGGSYQGVTWGGYKYTGLMLKLVPELKNYWPDKDLKIVEYSYRIGTHGAWTLPDPCSKVDPGQDNTCRPGSGRFPELHGTNQTAGGACRTSTVGEFMFTWYKDYQAGVGDRSQKSEFRIQKSLLALTINPQPCRVGQIVLISSEKGSIGEIKITDATGMVVDEVKSYDSIIQWMPHDLKPGIYYIQLDATSGKLLKRIAVVE
jgi:hypothetical protein